MRVPRGWIGTRRLDVHVLVLGLLSAMILPGDLGNVPLGVAPGQQQARNQQLAHGVII